jgi:CDP-glucose 4,6-dehydratase
METVEIMDQAFWQGKRVFLTGHTGFKGAWLTVWLSYMGAEVSGYALAPETKPNLYDQANVAGMCAESTIADLADLELLKKKIANFKPDIVIHMAAQALVRRSYREPLATIAANITGTAHLLEACRDVVSIRSCVIVTTDKCYENKETGQRYKESDAMGGRDVYSASKGCAELITAAWRASFFDAAQIRIGSARAGNVIGGGDFAEDRLIPDAVRAFQAGRELVIRAPKAVRPWQHVAEPLEGYLTFAQALYENKKPLSASYNFGPDEGSIVPVADVIDRFAKLWPNALWKIDAPKDAPHEATLLALDATLAKKELGWKPRFTLDEALKHTAAGYIAKGPEAARHIVSLLEAA